ncbi:NUDIX domain-containing protein [Angustibacter aerolatus]
MPEQLLRPAARLLCVDPSGAVLLLGCVDPARPHLVHWIAPGGGVEPGEQPHEAVVREAWEELGLVLDDLGGAVARSDDAFSWAGQPIVGQNSWFAVRTPRFDPVARGMSDDEAAATVGARWFLPDELGSLPAGEVVEPTRTAELVRRAHATLPAEPHRPTARVLVVSRLDGVDRVVLVSTAAVEGGTVWFAPGGGVEVGEDHRAAAVRELAEELRLEVDPDDLGDPVWVRRHRLPGAVDLREVYYLLRLDEHGLDLDLARVDAGFLAAEGVTGVRWFTVDELERLRGAAAGEIVAPRDLASRLPALLAADPSAGRPAAPVEVPV